MRDILKRMASWKFDVLGEQFSVVYAVFILVVLGFCMVEAWWGFG